MDTLRFITAGSVDDGKSTLIGRLLHDSRSILADQLAAISRPFQGNTELDLALLTDGLRAEREQGITIDVAYKYFSTSRRKFIIADTPGHVQYTRNMVTGASTADLAVILVDARKGVVEQTRRHTLIVVLLGIPQIILAVNKMDLIHYNQKAYDTIVNQYEYLAGTLGLKKIISIPVSAKDGDNIVEKSPSIPWYQGPVLLEALESVPAQKDPHLDPARFPVQYVIRPQRFQSRRIYAGKIISGIYRRGDTVTIFPEGIQSKIVSIAVAAQEVEEAFALQSVTMQLQDEIDISRGDMIVKSEDLPNLKEEFEALLCWMNGKPLKVGGRYLLQINSCRVKSIVKEIIYRIDVNTMQKEKALEQVGMNELIKVKIKTASPIAYDPYEKLRANGAAILIDKATHATAAACMLE